MLPTRQEDPAWVVHEQSGTGEAATAGVDGSARAGVQVDPLTLRGTYAHAVGKAPSAFGYRGSRN